MKTNQTSNAGKKLLLIACIIALSGFSYPGITEGFMVGNRAPEIKMKDPQGKEILLSSLRGNIVLLDFWASWCMPCRFENRNVVSVYEEFRNTGFKNAKGFTIFSVSLDNNAVNWAQAIKADNLSWPSHGSELMAWSSHIVQQYGVTGIPCNYLLDKNGVIIAKDLRGVDLRNKILELAKAE
jgi:thiol-disulfide isomerase/thioredoxin